MLSMIGTLEEYRASRLALLAKEQEHTRTADAINAERRALPIIPVTKDYTFQSPIGPVTLKDLFGAKSQLIVYHFMFEATAKEGCHGCSFMAANFPDLRHLAQKDTALVAISRAPIGNITTYKERNSWSFPWVSSYGSNFNHDFHVTLDEKVAPAEDNFLYDTAEKKNTTTGEQPGLSVFKLENDQVYHTYSTFHRLESLAGTYVFLDLTPAGRQEGPLGPAEFKTPAEYEDEKMRKIHR